jgi:FtsP/CotA-like multicopper oxidase with cupredoxin domain
MTRRQYLFALVDGGGNVPPEDGELDYDHEGHRGASGRVMLVNGAPWPVLEVAARNYRFRILNASNATAMRLALSTHHPLTQIGSDQGLLAAPVVLPTIALAMAERVEVVVDFSVCPLGTHVVLENRRGRGASIRSCGSTSFAPCRTTAAFPSVSATSSRCDAHTRCDRAASSSEGRPRSTCRPVFAG